MDSMQAAAAPQRPGEALRAGDWLALALLGVACVPGILAMARIWGSVEYYSHGYLVPVVALLLALRERERLRETPTRRTRAGLGLLVVALAVYGLGAAAGLVELQGSAIVAAIAAAVLWLRGPAWLRVLAFPIAYLIFMIPLPDAWIQPLILRLRLFVTTGAVALLHGVGVAVLRDGNVLTLPGGESLFVADACSGVTSLVTLTPLAVLVAQLTERVRWRRCLIVLAVIPIALLFNLARVVGTVIAAQHVGAEAATSAGVHEAAGLLTYAVGCLALLAVASLLRRGTPAA
jgi:exosortase